MITIHKYKLELVDEQVIEIGQRSLNFIHTLTADVDPNGDLCIWAVVNTKHPLKKMRVVIYGTGKAAIHNLDELTHLGTVVMHTPGAPAAAPAFVWHVFHLAGK